MLNLILVLAGFIPLVYGANLLVDSASSLARRLNIPIIVIGLTVVSFGTSAPELVVNVFSAFDNTDIVLGNIIGSNIFNILAILGIASIIYPLTVKTNTTWIEILLALLSAALVLISGNDIFIDGGDLSAFTRIDGLVFLLFFLVFLGYNTKLALAGNQGEEIEIKDYSVIKSIIFILLGLVLLMAGGKIIVTFSVKLAQMFNVSERIISLTIISIGTSLPEFATSITAAMKRNVDIAIGNIVGSNIFNVFFILGLSAIINPVKIKPVSNLDMLVNLISSILLFIFIFTGKDRKLERWEGIIFIVVYLSYISLLLLI